MDHLLSDHKRAMEEELVICQKLCKEAGEDMIQSAKAQFKQVNGACKKLKHNFDHCGFGTGVEIDQREG
jgi:hypothetical protein